MTGNIKTQQPALDDQYESTGTGFDAEDGKHRNDDATMRELAEAHLPLVRHVVRELLARVPAHVRRDELMSAGYEALAHAARCFDASRGAPFSSYANVRVRGALLDELRRADWASRSVRSKARKLDTARDAFVVAHGRTPSDVELGEKLDMSVRDVASIRDDVQRSVLLRLEGAVGDTNDDEVSLSIPDPSPNPEQTLLERERIGYLRDAIEALPERLRTVIEQYYFAGRQMSDIAADMGVTESRVSHLRAEATVLMREALNTHLDPDRVTDRDATGCAARRRAAYYASVASQATLHSRLARTSSTGMPVDLSA
ncbi:hypothetical protein GCM10022243_40960 [Saccharothrix violaceirubra]|uniref:RNA polymerase sigma factor for flagellar operon FliA n=1 Tax=Saccharothrix violaceirubra TaxID=413306 RepID=A0A7W7T9A4_9PSEU|nr:sigma-70 family RNA polymerase sigma factor [Saccharothrix violaceirubra]MBB4968352.1 RNA polymerase sigma factor for flagellar operon FliA [Saccharothrix violaceirubra]